MRLADAEARCPFMMTIPSWRNGVWKISMLGLKSEQCPDT